ncbi:UpxY family transcription antiterminator [soil metagenome]
MVPVIVVPTARAINRDGSNEYGTTASDVQWHVLYVKSRQEKALGDELAAMRIEYYLPLVRHPRFYGKKKSQVELPLFPGYLFLLGSLENVYSADRTKRVARIIHVADQGQLERDLENLNVALTSGAILRTHAFLAKGTRVEVMAGPLKGLQGVVDDPSKPRRLILQVEMLTSAASLEIDGALVQPIR